MLSECKHQSFVYGLDYCPQCGETDISKLLHERYIHELMGRIKELEARAIGLPPTHEPSEFVTDVDGYVYYWPHGSTGGHYAAHHLRRIATELDDRNREWHDQIMNDPVLGGGEK